MTNDEFDSLRRGDVVRWDEDGALGLVTRRGTKEVLVRWEDDDGDTFIAADKASEMMIVAQATSKASQ